MKEDKKYTVTYDNNEGKQRLMCEYFWEVNSPFVVNGGIRTSSVIAFVYDESDALRIVKALNLLDSLNNIINEEKAKLMNFPSDKAEQVNWFIVNMLRMLDSEQQTILKNYLTSPQ